MLVDPELLRAFASQVGVASTAIAETNLGHATASAADGLTGSTTQWAAGLVGEHLGGIISGISAEVAKMGEAVRGAGDNYQVQDDTLANSFTGLFEGV